MGILLFLLQKQNCLNVFFICCTQENLELYQDHFLYFLKYARIPSPISSVIAAAMIRLGLENLNGSGSIEGEGVGVGVGKADGESVFCSMYIL